MRDDAEGAAERETLEVGRRGFMTAPGEGESLPTAGGHALALAAQTDGRLTVIDSRVGPHDETPLHVHAGMDEAFYIIDGAYTVRCGDDTFEASAGCFVYLPRGVPHGWRAGSHGGHKLVLGIPAGLEGFFRDMAELDDRHELGRRHGITFL